MAKARIPTFTTICLRMCIVKTDSLVTNHNLYISDYKKKHVKPEDSYICNFIVAHKCKRYFSNAGSVDQRSDCTFYAAPYQSPLVSSYTVKGALTLYHTILTFNDPEEGSQGF